MRHGHRGHGSHGRRRLPAIAWRVHHGLRRSMFRAFGLAILISAALGWGVHAMLEPSKLAVPVALALAAAVLWMAAGGIAWALTRPLIELVSVARAIGEGKLDRRMRLAPFGRRGREVAMIAEAINTMATRIERQLADQRELLAAVSHELRTPLGHVRVLIDTARERPGLDREQRSTLDELEREVVELDGLVDQLLVHSRLEFERIEARRLDPVGVAVRALERVGDDAGRLDIETEVESIVGDPTLLGRALANLLSNARTHGHGLERLRVYDDDGLLCFDIEDRGPGFADGEHERVFESFVQGRAREGGSLGLGLSLVSRIARAHGGRAWARNRAQGGACVGFGVALDGGPPRGDAVIASAND